MKAQRNADREAVEKADEDARKNMAKLAEAIKVRKEKEAKYLAAQKEIKEREKVEDARCKDRGGRESRTWKTNAKASLEA